MSVQGFSIDPMKVKVKLLSPVRLFATPWTVAHQIPLSMGFSRQEYWSGLPCPLQIYHPNTNQKKSEVTVLSAVITESFKIIKKERKKRVRHIVSRMPLHPSPSSIGETLLLVKSSLPHKENASKCQDWH